MTPSSFDEAFSAAFVKVPLRQFGYSYPINNPIDDILYSSPISEVIQRLVSEAGVTESGGVKREVDDEMRAFIVSSEIQLDERLSELIDAKVRYHVISELLNRERD